MSECSTVTANLMDDCPPRFAARWCGTARNAGVDQMADKQNARNFVDDEVAVYDCTPNKLRSPI